MAHSLSSKKRIRQNEKRRIVNRSRRATLKTRVRRFEEAVSEGNAEQAAGSLKDACKTLDREANRGLIHPNAAARKKSRLTKRLNNLKKAAKTS